MTEQALFDTAPFTQEPGPETWFPEGIFKGQPRPDEFHDLVVRRVVEEVLQVIKELVAKLIDQWADGKRTLAERRESLPMLCDLRAALDRIISADESALAVAR